jgi:hypothetical protein
MMVNNATMVWADKPTARLYKSFYWGGALARRFFCRSQALLSKLFRRGQPVGTVIVQVHGPCHDGISWKEKQQGSFTVGPIVVVATVVLNM